LRFVYEKTMAEPEIMFADTEPAAGIEDPVIDAQVVAPQGEPCEACGSPVEALDKFCPACGAPHETQQAENENREERPQNFFRCESCGSEVATDSDQRSYVCAFCDSSYVVELSPEQSDRQRPEFVIGFAVTPDQAREKFHQWLRSNSWFRPGDLRAAQIAERLKGVYLPFWSFSMLARSNWQASIGEHWYRTETYTTTNSDGKTVTRTRQVQETEWWPLAGAHHYYYSGYLVSGSRGLSQADAARIKPFQLPAMKRYQPYFLAGWLSEEYSVSREDASVQCQQEFRRREQSHVGAFLPGDTHRGLQVDTRFSHVNSDLCLLPVYVLSYRYKDKLYRFLVNGQTGKVAGDKPVSALRIGLAIGAGLLLVLLAFLVIALLSGS
jgi:hypothetical protein